MPHVPSKGKRRNRRSYPSAQRPSRSRRAGSASSYYGSLRAAGVSPERAFKLATGRSAASVFKSKGR